jgi:hypothetical protein
VASPRTRSFRSSDIKLIVSATVAVVLIGLFVAGALLLATKGGGNVVCGPLNLGSASDIRHRLQDGGPYFEPGAVSCGFWLALADDNIVAYKVDQPGSCPLQRKRDHWQCGSKTVDAADLAQYPVSIRRFNATDSVFVDLTPTGNSSTSSAG